MAYTVTFGNNGRPAKYREFEIDTPDDLADIGINDADVGSTAHSRSDNTTYKLGNNREWYALTEGGGGGGGGESPVFILPFVLDEGNRYISTVKWNELGSAIEAQKIIQPVIDNSTPELSFYDYGYSVSIGQGVMEGVWGIGGTFKGGQYTYQMVGTESDLNDPVTATMIIG